MRQNTCENPTTAVALIYVIQIERTGDLLPLQVVLGDDLVSLTEALQHNFETIRKWKLSILNVVRYTVHSFLVLSFLYSWFLTNNSYKVLHFFVRVEASRQILIRLSSQ